MRRENVTLRLGEAVAKVFIDERDRIVTELKSGKRIIAGTLLFTVGRQGATDYPEPCGDFCLAHLLGIDVGCRRRTVGGAHAGDVQNSL